jgi:hypothetical protein
MVMRTPSPFRLAALVLGVSLASTAGAQPLPYTFSAAVFSTPQAGDLLLRIEFISDGLDSDYHWPETPAGLDLYRRVIGFECGDFERLNPEPFPFTPYGDIDYLDGTTLPGNSYEYRIRAVDSNRDPVIANPEVRLGFATNGEALIGHGTIFTHNLCGYPGPYYVHASCSEECFPGFVGWNFDPLVPYANTGQTVSIYGAVWMLANCEGDYETFADITRVEPSTCLVAVEPATWGGVKRLYRDATP